MCVWCVRDAQTLRVQEQAERERVDEYVNRQYHDDLKEVTPRSSMARYGVWLPLSIYPTQASESERPEPVLKRLMRVFSSSPESMMMMMMMMH